MFEEVFKVLDVLMTKRCPAVVRHAASQRKALIAATVSPGALRFGQCPTAFSSTSRLFGRLRCTYSPTHCGAMTSSEHWRISEGMVTCGRSARLSDRNV